MHPLERLRTDRGLTQKALAVSAGVAVNTVARIEAGAIPNAHTAKRLADVLGVVPSELVVELRAAESAA